MCSTDILHVPIFDKMLSRYFDIRYYAGIGDLYAYKSKHRANIAQRLTILSLDDKEYPPLLKTFKIYDELTRIQPMREWYMRCDADAIVDGSKLRQTLQEYAVDHDRALAIGARAKGRELERKVLQFRRNFTSYLNGGSCEIVNAKALLLFRLKVFRCIFDSARTVKRQQNMHSDVETSRCFHSAGVTFRYRSDMTSSSKNTLGQFWSDRPVCTSNEPTWLTKHPFKDPNMKLLQYFPHLCRHVKYVRRPTDNPSEGASRTTPAFIVSFRHDRTLPSNIFFPQLYVRPLLQTNEGFLTEGEVSYREVMHRTLTTGVQGGTPWFATFDDDFALHKDFAALWPSVSPDLDKYDVVLLGSAIWSTKTWSLVKVVNASMPRLYNGVPGIYGSFSVLWSINAAKAVLDWLDVTTGLYPFDHVWTFLTGLRMNWGFAHPPLVVMRPHDSTIDMKRKNIDRFTIHRWGRHDLYEL